MTTTELVRKGTDGILTLHRGRTFVGWWRSAKGYRYSSRRPVFDAIIYPRGREPVLIEGLFASVLRDEIARRTEAEGWEFPTDRFPDRPPRFRTP